jgi:hypothetical protein
MSVSEFRKLSDSLPQSLTQIQSLILFKERGHDKYSAAIATFDEKLKWQIDVFSPVATGGYEIEWKSNQLSDAFSVSYPDALKRFNLDGEQVVLFEGCAPHVCPNVYSILLYVPSKRAAFVANAVWGKISFSPSLDTDDNADYKRILSNLVKNHDN